MAQAVRAVETGNDTLEDLRYLQGKGTSLGGMRPKCSVLDENGQLAIGKFPSVNDTLAVTRGEVLALHLAERAGIEAAKARVIDSNGTPVALVQRFDRTADGARTPYLSAASMLQAQREETRSYAEVVDQVMRYGSQPHADARALWRRLVFNLLITKTDDHLHNSGFLYAGAGLWRLSPAFDLNPMPGKLRESKTWLSPDSGPIASVAALLEQAAYFHLTPQQARVVLGEVVGAVQSWRTVGMQPAVGLTRAEAEAFEDAFDMGRWKRRGGRWGWFHSWLTVRRCARGRGTRQAVAGTSTVRRPRPSSLRKSRSKVTRCSPCCSTAAASQASGKALPASCRSRHKLRKRGHSAPSGVSCTPELASRASMKATACAVGVGAVNIFRLVTRRKKLASTMGISTSGGPSADWRSAASSQPRA
jgi:hypothetical protein